MGWFNHHLEYAERDCYWLGVGLIQFTVNLLIIFMPFFGICPYTSLAPFELKKLVGDSDSNLQINKCKMYV